MDKSVKDRVAKLLGEASKLLSCSANGSSNGSPNRSSSGSSNRSNGNANQFSYTLSRAQRMLAESSSSRSLARRLNRQERLRLSASPITKPAKEKKKKVVEFSMLRCREEEEEGPYNLTWDSVIASGMLLLQEGDSEATIRRAIKASLVNKFPIISEKDFDFVKVKRKCVRTLELSEGVFYDFEVVKKMAGQGSLYVQLKRGYEFVCTETVKEDDEGISCLDSNPDSSCEIQEQGTDLSSKIQQQGADLSCEIQGQGPDLSCEIQDQGPDLSCEIQDQGPDLSCEIQNQEPDLSCEISSARLTDPVEILRFLQKRIVRGRDLDIEYLSDTIEGRETDFICVNRDDILETTFAELKDIEDYRLTFEVDFMGEMANHLGGPRKEWIRLMNQAIKKKYFDNGLRNFLADDYYYVGIMIAIALLQNGQLPSFMPIDIIDKIVDIPNQNPCIANLQKGLDVFGLAKIMCKLPVLLHLLLPSTRGISAKKLIHLLKRKFSTAGSSAYLREKELHALFVKYIREVASGRREPITLSSILIFATAASEEPVLGFAIAPSIEFTARNETAPSSEEAASQLDTGETSSSSVCMETSQKIDEVQPPSLYSYLPTSHTCSNNLVLPIGSFKFLFPRGRDLFEVYDMAFSNTQFGKI